MNRRRWYLDTAYVLLDRGWCQNRAKDDLGRVCLATALRYAASYAPSQAIELLRITGPIVNFNDEPDMTQNDVIAALKMAADLAA